MEDARWKTEDARWKTEDGRWKTEDGRWKTPACRQGREDGNWLFEGLIIHC